MLINIYSIAVFFLGFLLSFVASATMPACDEIVLSSTINSPKTDLRISNPEIEAQLLKIMQQHDSLVWEDLSHQFLLKCGEDTVRPIISRWVRNAIQLIAKKSEWPPMRKAAAFYTITKIINEKTAMFEGIGQLLPWQAKLYRNKYGTYIFVGPLHRLAIPDKPGASVLVGKIPRQESLMPELEAAEFYSNWSPELADDMRPVEIR